MSMNRVVLLAILFFLFACTPESEPASQPDAPDVKTVTGQGEHGLAIELSGREEVKGGELFDISYAITDDEGDLRGVEIDWGDGKTWGGMPSDLVCSSSTGMENPSEGPTEESEEMSHAYRQPGPYDIILRAYTGGCFAHWDRTEVLLRVEVVGLSEVLNGPMEPRAKIGHAYYTNGDPNILVSDIGGYDEDGFVQRIDIDWGDGSAELLEQDWERCAAVEANYPGGWFSEPMEHAYEEPGDYLVKIEVTSVGCDGETVQTDEAQRTLEFPPKQGS